jgi:hypothetical protein
MMALALQASATHEPVWYVCGCLLCHLPAGYQAATSLYLSRSSSQPRGSSSPGGAGGQPKRTWLPSGSGKVAAGSMAATASRSLSLRPGSAGCSGNGGAKEALRESVLGQRALAERRKRLQALYSELRQQ